MREINQTEIAAVSGAGLMDIMSGVNNDLVKVSDLFDATVKSMGETTVVAEQIGLTYKAFGLSLAKGFLSAFSNFLNKLA